ncbi:hypothetical protein EPN96_09965 [bacterium]|nr:MAG: hypothetical protein EPN96_09965 [bacterium]
MKQIGGLKRFFRQCLGVGTVLLLAAPSYSADFINRWSDFQSDSFKSDTIHIPSPDPLKAQYFVAGTAVDCTGSYAALIGLDANGDPAGMGAKQYFSGQGVTLGEIQSGPNMGKILFVGARSAPYGYGSNWVGIIDPNDPDGAGPLIAGYVVDQTEFGFYGAFKHVAMAGNYAFLVSQYGEVVKLDLSNLSVADQGTFPVFPVKTVGVYNGAGTPYLYLAGTSFVLRIAQDTLDPVSMITVDNLASQIRIYGISVSSTDGSMILAGYYTTPYTDIDGWFMRLTSAWEKTYERGIGGPGSEWCSTVATYSNSDLDHILGCSSTSYTPVSNYNPVAIKFKETNQQRSNINVTWEKKFIMPYSAEVEGKGIATSDGGAMLTSKTSDAGGGEIGTLFVKTDGSGNVLATDWNGNPVANPFIADLTSDLTVYQLTTPSTITVTGVTASGFDPLQAAQDPTDAASDVTAAGFSRIANISPPAP